MTTATTASLTGKQWLMPRAFDSIQARQASALSDKFGVSDAVARLLIRRGASDETAARRVLHPSLEDLHDPSLMLDMDVATTRILRAIDAGERILIYGDYDVDGTTGTVLLRRVLKILGGQTGYYIPHRFTEGYGINHAALANAKAYGYTLVVSVDCGIRAFEPLNWARENNLDCIITDHHLPDSNEGRPPAIAVLNPNQANCAYPDKHLAGVGVAFKLAHALLRERGRDSLVAGFLKMVAIGTVADIAPLTGENRAIVKLGLADLSKATNHGLRALMEVAGCVNKDASKSFAVNSTDIGFRIAPRINAAGRMDAAGQIVELFEATSAAQANELAANLDKLNRERQTVQAEIVERAMDEMKSNLNASSHVAVVAGEGWHRGVIGLAASKIAEAFNRPSIVISLDGEHGHGSARSIDGYHLLNGLSECADLFDQFGGHAAAAGLQIRHDRIDELRRRLNSHAAAHFGFVTPVQKIEIDTTLDQADIKQNLVDDIAALEPFGMGWRRPVFHTANLRILYEPRVMKDKHLKLHCADANGGGKFELVWWSGVEHLRNAGAATINQGDGIEAVYCLENNDWQGTRRVQLVVKDLRKNEVSG